MNRVGIILTYNPPRLKDDVQKSMFLRVYVGGLVLSQRDTRDVRSKIRRVPHLQSIFRAAGGAEVGGWISGPQKMMHNDHHLKIKSISIISYGANAHV